MNRLDDLHPVELLLLAGALLIAATATVARLLIVPLLALALVACGWRPAPAPRPLQEQHLQEAPAAPAPRLALEAMPVAALRRLARERGLARSLTRSGRRADLLLALA